MPRCYYLYILASPTRRLLIGMTPDLRGRLRRYASGRQGPSRGLRLVFFEVQRDLAMALTRRDQIHRLRREEKVALIESHNAGWLDLAVPWFGTGVLPLSRKGEGAGG